VGRSSRHVQPQCTSSYRRAAAALRAAAGPRCVMHWLCAPGWAEPRACNEGHLALLQGVMLKAMQ